MAYPRKLWNFITFKLPGTALHVINNHANIKLLQKSSLNSMALSAAYSTGWQHPVQTGISFHFFLHVIPFNLIKWPLGLCPSMQSGQKWDEKLLLYASCHLEQACLSLSASLAFHFIWSLSWKLLPSPLPLSSCSEITLLVSVKRLRCGVCMTEFKDNPLTFA